MTELSAPGRVLHVVRRFGEPSQTFISDAVLELQRRGWESQVLSLLAPVGSAKGVRVVQMKKPPLVRRLVGRATRRPPRTRAVNWWAPAVAAARPDLLHIHFGWTAAQVDLEALGVPALVSFHGTDVNAWPHRHPSNLDSYRQLFAQVDHVTAVSEVLAERLRRLGYGGEIELIPAGVMLERFPFRAPTGDPRAPRLLFVGRLVACKGLDTLISALPLVVDRSPQVRLDVIGDGALRSEAGRLADELGVAGRIHFHGAQPHAQVAQAMRDADVLVVPSRRTSAGEEEGSPVAPKEALAIGAPVVATSVGGIPDTIPPDYRHELVPPDDPQALAAQVLRVLEEPHEWDERARVGRAWVEREFDWRELGGRIDALYRRLQRSATAVGSGS